MTLKKVNLGANKRRSQPNHCEHHGEYDQEICEIAGVEIRGICPGCFKDNERKQRLEQKKTDALSEIDNKIPIDCRSLHFAHVASATDEQKRAKKQLKQWVKEYSDLFLSRKPSA